MRRHSKLPTFNERLNMLLIDSGKTIVAFAKMLGTSRQSLGYYLNGDRIPDARVVRQICEKCHVSSDWLLGLSDVKKPDVDTQAVCKYTGLSENAIGFLKIMNDASNPRHMKLINAFLTNVASRMNFLLSLADLYNAYRVKIVNKTVENNEKKEDEIYGDEFEKQKNEYVTAMVQMQKNQRLEFEQFLSKKEMNEALDALFDSDELFAIYQEESGNGQS